VDAFFRFLESPTAERIFASIVLIFVGGFLGWVGHRWRHFRQQQAIEQGDARDVVTIEKVLIDVDSEGIETLRIRTCGRDPVEQIFPNPAARESFHDRTVAIKPTHPLISMDGKMGSYLLQELAIWVCSQVGERDFPHDVWVMAAVCEPATFGGHRSSTVLLVRRDDLPRFRKWLTCRDIQVEHGGHGERILTLLSVAQEFERQSLDVAKRQSEGRRPGFEETMYLLDLALDQRLFDLPGKPVPWGRFEATLKVRGLE
jgi:hypothetical protein